MNTWINTLALAMDEDTTKLIVVGGFIVGGILVYKLIEVLGNTARAKQTEQTRREVAAYVAEGSMTPETAEKLLRSGAPENWSDRVAELMAYGTIDSNEAEKLLKVVQTRGDAGPAKA